MAGVQSGIRLTRPGSLGGSNLTEHTLHPRLFWTCLMPSDRMEPLIDSRRRWVRDPHWWRQFIARRKRSRFGWVRHWWTLVDQKIPWPDAE